MHTFAAPARKATRPPGRVAAAAPASAGCARTGGCREQVISAPKQMLRRVCACGGGCPTCRGKHSAHEHAHTKNFQPAPTEENEAPAIVHEALRSPVQYLDSATRAFMEPRFGRDFSQVRVHTGAKAAASAGAIDALAYTVTDVR